MGLVLPITWYKYTVLTGSGQTLIDCNRRQAHSSDGVVPGAGAGPAGDTQLTISMLNSDPVKSPETIS